MSTESIEHEITRLESERCRALVDGDLTALSALVADDLVHIHANGKVDDKSAYLALVRDGIAFLSARREKLDVRVFGDIAVATGALAQAIMLSGTTQRQDMNIMTTQVWRLNQGVWQQVSFQATNIH